jgi:hypothetical protein
MARIEIIIEDLDNGKFSTTVTPAASQIRDVLKDPQEATQAYNVAGVAIAAIRKYQMAMEKETWKKEHPNIIMPGQI